MKKYLLLSLTLFGSISYAMPGKEGCNQELYNAISEGNEADIKLLLDNGANANHVHATSSMTPLRLATSWDNEAAAKLLLDNGADVNARQWGYTAFDMAVLTDNEAIARLLLERGANPLTQNVGKENPLDNAKSDPIRKLIKNEISKRRAAMIWTLKGVHHTGPQAGQELEQKDSLPALPSLEPEIVEKIMLKADPTLKRTLIRKCVERKKESVSFEQMEFSDIIQRFDTSLLTIASALR